MTTETYDKRQAKRINSRHPSELGEGGPFLPFDFPDDLTYADYPITEMGYDGWRVYVEYEGESLDEGWDYFLFQTELRDDGTIVVTNYPAGLMTAEEVYETATDAPHAKSLRPVYDALKNVGVKLE